MVSRSIESAQTKIEGWNFDARKYLVQYDDVIAGQRAVIYADRQRILAGEDVNEIIVTMVHEELEGITSQYLADEFSDNWDVEGLLKAVAGVFPVPEHMTDEYLRAQKKSDLIQELQDEADLAYERREEQFGPEIMRQAERFFLLSIIDRRWVQHIDALDELREGVQLQTVGQRDPLVEFRKTASSMFNELQETIRHEVVHVIYQFDVQIQMAPPVEAPPQALPVEPPTNGDGHPLPLATPLQAAPALAASGATATAVAEAPKVTRAAAPGQSRPAPQSARPPTAVKLGRNDPCWCGSGKKYKQCHGRG
jgi:preprotein translocase subunit SecA